MKNRGNKKVVTAKNKIIHVTLLVCMAVLLTGCQSSPNSTPKQVMATSTPKTSGKIAPTSDEIIFHEGNLQITIFYGIKGNVKHGRYLPVTAQITNSGEKFSGYFQAIIPTGETSYLMEEEVTVEKGTSQRVTLSFPCYLSKSRFAVRLLNGYRQQICQKTIRAKVQVGTKKSYIGVVSGNNKNLEYLNTKNTKMFYLSQQDITDDAHDLDLLDVILLNDVDVNQLRAEQVSALHNWALNGGTLVIAANSYPFATRNGAEEKFGKLTVLEQNRFFLVHSDAENISNSVVKVISPVSLAGGTPLSKASEYSLLQKKKCGYGNIVVSECSFYLEKKQWNPFGNYLLSRILSCYSKTKKAQLKREQERYSYEDNHIYQYGLQVNNTDRLPNMVLYGGALALYVFLIGPVFYIYYYKRKRLQYLWLAIPVTSVLFAIAIYILGISTRISYSYANYLTQLEIDKGNAATLNTYFRITSPGNQDYQVQLNHPSRIQPLLPDTSYYSFADTGKVPGAAKNHVGIRTESDSSTLFFTDLSSFSGFNLKTSEAVKTRGEVSPNLISDNGLLRGSITNNLSYNLQDCFVFYHGTIYSLGDIKKGKSVIMSKLSSSDVKQQMDYGYDEGKLVKSLFGVSYNTASGSNMDSNTRRKSALLEAYLNRSDCPDCFFYGFASSSCKDNTVINHLSCDANGVTAVSQILNVNDKMNGYDVLSSLGEYAYKYQTGDTDGKYIYNYSKETIKVTYKIPDKYSWQGLIYNKNNNPEFSYYMNGYPDFDFFDGTISAENRTTGKKETLFVSGREREMEDMENYLNDDGTLTLFYHINTAQDCELVLPNIRVLVK